MELLLLILILVCVGLVLLCCVVSFLSIKRVLERNTAFDSHLEHLEKGLESVQKAVDTQLHRNAETMQRQMRDQFQDSKKLVEDITREMTKVKETGRQMLSFTEQVQSLEKMLKNPQRRGVIGEYVLERIISNVLPPDSYKLQYSFQSGVRADAVIFLQDEKMVSVDAKFSLDNYARLLNAEVENPQDVERQLRDDLKKRIQETAKYILPDEGTLDFAFMFIPSESLYYDLLTEKVGAGDSLLEFAFTKYRVIIVSPTILLAYLQTVTLGLRSLKIEEHVREVEKRVGMLKQHLDAYSSAFHGVGKALGTAVNHYNKAEQQYGMIDRDVLKITGEGGSYEREVLEKPHSSERE